MEPAVEELDLEALVKGGTIKPKRMSASLPPASQGSRNLPPAHVAITAPVGTVFEDDAIVDSSSWSESDEEDMEEMDKDSSEEKTKPEASSPQVLEDPLGILGNLNLKQYDARFDLASVKFDPAALLSGVHYATSYDKLRTALETLKPLHLQEEQKKGPSLGMTEGNNFDRFVATSNTVVAFREEIIKAGLGGGRWTQEMDEGLERCRTEIASVMKQVFVRREETRKLARVARFVARYRTVLNLPETLRSLISSPSGYGQAAREYRKAQRVLRGAAGPVFREVLAELENVASRWKVSLYSRLGSEFVGSAGSAEHVVEAVRALRELGSTPEPGVYFSQQQMVFALNRVNQVGHASPSEVLHEVHKLLPALRLAYSKLGAGAAEGGALHSGVWGSCLEQCCDAVKLMIKDGARAGDLLGEVQRFQDQLGECLQGASGSKERQSCFVAVGNFLEWLRLKSASHIRLECLRECSINPEPLPAIIRAVERLAPVIGDAGAVDAGLACLCRAVDLIVRNCDAAVSSPFTSSWNEAMPPEKKSPEDALLDCAVSAQRLLANGVAAVAHSRSGVVVPKSRELFDSLCASAKERALRAYVARMAFFVRRIVAENVAHEVREEFQNRLDGKGAMEETSFAPANQYSSAAPVALVERSLLSDWALEAVQLLIVVRSHVDGRLAEDSPFVMKSLATSAVSIVEDVVENEREMIGKNLAMRFAVSVRFLADVLSFSDEAHLIANLIISRTLKVKSPPAALEKASLLKRCFATDEGSSSVISGNTGNTSFNNTVRNNDLAGKQGRAAMQIPSSLPSVSKVPKETTVKPAAKADANPFAAADSKAEDSNPFSKKPEDAARRQKPEEVVARKPDVKMDASKETNRPPAADDSNPFAKKPEARKDPSAFFKKDSAHHNSAPSLSRTPPKESTNPFE